MNEHSPWLAAQDDCDEDDAFLARLREVPPTRFTAALRARLAEQEAGHTVSPIGRWGIVRRLGAGRARLAAVAAAVILLLGAALAAPAVARGLLPHVAPHEVATVPTPIPAALPTPPATPQRTAVEDLAQQAGFTPLVPAWLPPGCAERERFSQPERQVINLVYACFDISEQIARGEQPRVGAGSTEAVTIGGQQAIYVHGAWVNYPSLPGTPGGMIWRDDLGGQLILEREGLVIHVSASGPRPTSKENLIRIAESLQPAK